VCISKVKLPRRSAQQDVVGTTRVAMTVHRTRPLHDTAKADANLAMRKTTGSTVLLVQGGCVQAVVLWHGRLLTR
jgi:hypothetical protein